MQIIIIKTNDNSAALVLNSQIILTHDKDSALSLEELREVANRIAQAAGCGSIINFEVDILDTDWSWDEVIDSLKNRRLINTPSARSCSHQGGYDFKNSPIVPVDSLNNSRRMKADKALADFDFSDCRVSEPSNWESDCDVWQCTVHLESIPDLNKSCKKLIVHFSPGTEQIILTLLE